MKNKELAFVFHKENCIQCHGCETACKTWRSVPLGIKWRRVLNVWDGSYPDIKCSSYSISCQHCVDPACVGACPVQAITKRDRDGVVVVDPEKCVGCRACLRACPFDVPQFGNDRIMQKCDMCQSEENGSSDRPNIPPCVRTCPTQALELKRLSIVEKAENEALLKSDYANIKKKGISR